MPQTSESVGFFGDIAIIQFVLCNCRCFHDFRCSDLTGRCKCHRHSFGNCARCPCSYVPWLPRTRCAWLRCNGIHSIPGGLGRDHDFEKPNTWCWASYGASEAEAVPLRQRHIPERSVFCWSAPSDQWMSCSPRSTCFRCTWNSFVDLSENPHHTSSHPWLWECKDLFQRCCTRCLDSSETSSKRPPASGPNTGLGSHVQQCFHKHDHWHRGVEIRCAVQGCGSCSSACWCWNKVKSRSEGRFSSRVNKHVNCTTEATCTTPWDWWCCSDEWEDGWITGWAVWEGCRLHEPRLKHAVNLATFGCSNSIFDNFLSLFELTVASWRSPRQRIQCQWPPRVTRHQRPRPKPRPRLQLGRQGCQHQSATTSAVAPDRMVETLEPRASHASGATLQCQKEGDLWVGGMPTASGQPAQLADCAWSTFQAMVQLESIDKRALFLQMWRLWWMQSSTRWRKTQRLEKLSTAKPSAFKEPKHQWDPAWRNWRAIARRSWTRKWTVQNPRNQHQVQRSTWPRISRWRQHLARKQWSARMRRPQKLKNGQWCPKLRLLLHVNELWDWGEHRCWRDLLPGICNTGRIQEILTWSPRPWHDQGDQWHLWWVLHSHLPFGLDGGVLPTR